MAMNKKAILERVSQANRQSEETWRRSMSSEATAGQTPDQYGQLHPVETEELLARKQVEFHEEIQKLPSKDRQGLIQAEEKCPELLTDKFKLMFLRAEVFNADVSTKTAKNRSTRLDRVKSLYSYRIFLVFLFCDMRSSLPSVMPLIGTSVLKSLVPKKPFSH